MFSTGRNSLRPPHELSTILTNVSPEIAQQSSRRLAFLSNSSHILTGRQKNFLSCRLHRTQPSACSSSRIQCNPSQKNISRRAILSLSVGSLLSVVMADVADAAPAGTTSAYDIVVTKNGFPLELNDYRGKITLFVNVATYCALTPQYDGLVALHKRFRTQGFEIVASPCDQFGRQEPGSNEEICQFAKKQFGAEFLLLDKLNVNDGPGGVAPLYTLLKDTSPEGTGQRVSWNFEKFLVGTDGKVLRRYKPGILPAEIQKDVEWAVQHPQQELPPKKKPSLGVE